MKHKTGLIALGVLAAATALMVFFVLPNIGEDKPVDDAQQSAQSGAAGEEKAADAASAGAKTSRTEPAPGTAAGTPTDGGTASGAGTAPATPTADAAANWQTPTFDVLRVEPDGSTVVAGRGEPNRTLQILNGDKVVATTDIGPSGEFAAVFDTPLPAGDHELTLRVLGEGGIAKTSEEVATVSIPGDSNGELLAMVSKPGTASRLITVPDTLQGQAPSTAEPASTQPAPTPPADGASDTAAVTQPATQPGTAAGQPAAGATAAAPATQPNVRISAVELEGERVFVAGSTRPGALVRIYANDKLLGEIKADAEGRYVVDGIMALAVGRHTIRADVMSDDAGKVELRASVPFDRPEGEQVAVVAQNEATAAAGAPSLGLIDDGSFDRLRAEANKAVALLGGLYANGGMPTAEQLAAARSATEIALQSLSQYKAPPGGAGEAIAARTSAVAAEALAKLKELPADAASVGKSLASIEDAVKDALTPATNGNAPAVAQAPVVDIDALEARALELSTKFAALFAEGRNALPTEIASARTSLNDALSEVVSYAAPTGTEADRLALVDQLKVWAKAAAAALAGVPADAAKDGYAGVLAVLKTPPAALLSQQAVAVASNEQAPAGTTAGSAASDALPATGQVAAQATVGQAAGQAADGEAQAAAAAADQPQTVEQAPLQASKNSVIIRRGDTLWQIARRVYGQGVRYTTIYLANEDQINNPDRIQPGQVFGVPDTAMPEAEAEQIHRKHLKAD